MLTIDRYRMTKACLENLIAKAGIPREDIRLLILDNGSKDVRTQRYIMDVADTAVLVPTNVGVAAGFNKLFSRITDGYICTVGNDIWLEQNWLKDLIDHQERIKLSGVSSIHCVLDKGRYTTNLGVFIPPHSIVYGVSLWSNRLMRKIGGFDERLIGYGCEDSQFAYRAYMTGHINYYIPGQYSYHLGEDQDQTSEYRKHKDESLQRNVTKLQETIVQMNKTNNYKIKL